MQLLFYKIYSEIKYISEENGLRNDCTKKNLSCYHRNMTDSV